MLLSFTGQGLPAHAFAIYNFSQVSDAALLITCNNEQSQMKEAILSYTDGEWHTDEPYNILNAENFHLINQKLKYELKAASAKKINSAPGMEHILMLLNLCS